MDDPVSVPYDDRLRWRVGVIPIWLRWQRGHWTPEDRQAGREFCRCVEIWALGDVAGSCRSFWVAEDTRLVAALGIWAVAQHLRLAGERAPEFACAVTPLELHADHRVPADVWRRAKGETLSLAAHLATLMLLPVEDVADQDMSYVAVTTLSAPYPLHAFASFAIAAKCYEGRPAALRTYCAQFDE